MDWFTNCPVWWMLSPQSPPCFNSRHPTLLPRGLMISLWGTKSGGECDTSPCLTVAESRRGLTWKCEAEAWTYVVGEGGGRRGGQIAELSGGGAQSAVCIPLLTLRSTFNLGGTPTLLLVLFPFVDSLKEGHCLLKILESLTAPYLFKTQFEDLVKVITHIIHVTGT